MFWHWMSALDINQELQISSDMDGISKDIGHTLTFCLSAVIRQKHIWNACDSSYHNLIFFVLHIQVSRGSSMFSRTSWAIMWFFRTYLWLRSCIKESDYIVRNILRCEIPLSPLPHIMLGVIFLCDIVVISDHLQYSIFSAHTDTNRVKQPSLTRGWLVHVSESEGLCFQVD